MTTTRFEIADYLDSEETIAEYLNTVLEDGYSSDLIVAIGHIAKAIGMTKIAKKNWYESIKSLQSIIGRSETAIRNNSESAESDRRSN